MPSPKVGWFSFRRVTTSNFRGLLHKHNRKSSWKSLRFIFGFLQNIFRWFSYSDLFIPKFVGLVANNLGPWRSRITFTIPKVGHGNGRIAWFIDDLPTVNQAQSRPQGLLGHLRPSSSKVYPTLSRGTEKHTETKASDSNVWVFFLHRTSNAGSFTEKKKKNLCSFNPYLAQKICQTLESV